MANLFKSQRFQKWASVGILLFILVTLPLLIFEVKQRQVTTQRASNTHTGGAQDFPCGPVTIKVFANELINNSTTSQQCGSGSVANLSSYRADFWIGLENGSSGNYNANWTVSANFCPGGAKQACTDVQKNIHGSGLLPTVASSGWQSPNFGNACGFYQDDLSFKITNSSGQTVCQWGDLNNPATGNYCNSTGTCLANAYYAICAASDASGKGVACTAVTPTNTPTPSPTNTPSNTPTNTPTPGVTITVTPTSTPSATPTPPNTNTPAPSSTPTNGPTVTPNPSSTPTNTPPPTNTPGPSTPTPTPKPTLPPTGPGNIFVNTGIAGIVIAIVGLFAAIGF